MDRINDLVIAVDNLAKIMGEMNGGHHYTAMQTITALEKMNERILELEKKIEPEVNVRVYREDCYVWIDVYVNGELIQHATRDID